ncbi:protein SOGA1-like [Notolabrus celidotus]|uniref:protein SOGA1-like n=1 Tax=Notolabrus celidotus TaxID=1203425 RepID=UPI00148FD3CE|nr:protein SOGA1-like [Notolabrus celidotus]
MSRDGDKSAKTVLRSQKQARTQQQVSVPKKKKDPSPKDEISKDSQLGNDSSKEIKSAGVQGKRAGKVSAGATLEGQKSPTAQRKLSDASNASEDLSKDSGCLSGKLSSDSSSEISDYTSDSNKQESPSCDSELSWTDGGAYVRPDSEGAGDAKPCVKASRDPCALQPDAAGGGIRLFDSSGTFFELMMGETTDDLVREVEDLRSENEYLKDEVEELRCEMLEMRDMFQEEEVYQLQELRLQLEQANKTCRILQYRLRKAERRSIRVAQTGQVDGELVRSLEHDIKVAKSVSLRLYNELEVVQKKNAQLEWENEALREKTQEQEVAKQVLQAEMDKAREGSLKKRSIRSSVSKAEKRLSQQIEDDSADLRCQLHFAKEELTLMCKKLTKLVSESEAMREELAKYRSAYGDLDASQFPEGKRHSARAREAEVKVHLKLVEEEATLLSRRIVELEVENRGLRTEMSDLREKTGKGGEEEEEENRDVCEENLVASTQVKEREGREQSVKKGCKTYKKCQEKNAEKSKSNVEKSQRDNQSRTERTMTACKITQEGPVGGKCDPSDTPESENKKPDGGFKGMTMKDYEALLALRDHSCILSSAIQLLMAPTKNGHSSSPSSAFTSPTEDSNSKAQKSSPPGPLNEALELLQAMLLTFIGRLETLLTGEDSDKLCVHTDRHVLESNAFSFLSGDHDTHSLSKQVDAEDLCTTEVKEKEKQTGQGPSTQLDLVSSCRDPKMRLTLQILWILHQWCQTKGSRLEGKEGKDKTMSVLHGLLQNISTELQGDPMDFGSQAKATQGKASECAISSIFSDKRRSEANRTYSSTWRRRRFPSHGCKRKNWCYVCQDAAQLDREDPVKTWDHLIMPPSFPDLDFEQMFLERSHTAPERSAFRIYYSPPSARRVQLAQLKQSPVTDRESFNSASPWCTPPTSFSQLCLGSANNLSDDMKEMTASWKQAFQSGSQEVRGRLQGRPKEGVCSCAQTPMKPQMVSVALQTEGTQGSVTTRSSPSRIRSPALVSSRSHHISTSLDSSPSRVERSRSSPKLYRRHSASSASSPPSSTNMSSSSSTQSTTRDRALWNLAHQSNTGLSWTRQTSLRGQNQSSVSSTKPPSKPAGANRYGMVTEFLRRVSGRADKPAPGSGQKMKSGLKTLERVPTRPPAAPLHRNDSVTRIVNQRFMKQREEAGRAQKEEKGGSLSQSVRHSQSQSTTTSEEGNYDCSSSSTLTFCFSRPSRSTPRQTSNQSKLPLHRYSPPASVTGDSSCE